MNLPFSRQPLARALLASFALLGAPAGAAVAAPLKTEPWQAAEPMRIEAAQLLADDRFWPGADRLVSSKRQGLRLLDAAGATLSALPGTFGALDHRASAEGLLVATVDVDRQQPVLLALSTRDRSWSDPVYLPRPDFKVDGLCLYRDQGDNAFLFLVGEEGIGEQWLVATAQTPLREPLRVRRLSLPPASEYCQVDDRDELLYVNEEAVGLWAYAAHPEADLVRQPVALVQPFGDIAEALAGVAVVPGAVLALDPAAGALHRYRRDGQRWQAEPALQLVGLAEPEQLSARLSGQGLALSIGDDNGQHRALLDWRPEAPRAAAPLPVLPAQVQTEPVPSLGDAADDPAIWIHPKDPAASRVLGTDKQGGLQVYDLQGRALQDLRVGRLNNVDVRPGFRLGQATVDLAVASHRDHNGLQLFAIDRSSGELSDLGWLPTPLDDIYGLCLFKDAAEAIHAIPNDKSGRFLQYRLDGRSGKVEAELMREFATASQPEGCVADDRNQRLFIGEEDVAVWTLDARGDAPAVLEKVIDAGAEVQADIEGLAFYRGEGGDYLVISSQGNDSFVVLDGQAPYAVRGAFRIGLNAERGIDGVSETDGLEVTSANLGGIWSRGMLVVQDGRKRMPEGRQNYKYLPWSAVAEALKLP
ncbi:3-phytase [Stutzerimonas nosocomialis]|uniref:phytase n=1 Tax=Stutzerimonas nosocomialis TaxID=1056496 RepID=UPI001108D787|nr:phytase [Stutzerimonas nosocomialis]TLX57922.1 3-phytase [Stutzerimonas nosocomialis]